MLETKVILKKLGCKKDIINKIVMIENNKVINLDPYSNNNVNNYISENIKGKILELPEFLKFLENENEFYVMNVKNIYECVLVLFDDEYFNEEEKINVKYADFLRIKLLTDLDEKFSDLKNKKKVREILDQLVDVNDEVFNYFKLYFGVNIFIINKEKKFFKKYENSQNDKCIFIIKINNNYYPIVGKKDNLNIRIFNNKDFEKYEFFNTTNKILEVNSDINYNKYSLPELQQKAGELNIKIMKMNRKGDKEIKKTKKELINEIELQN
jgi:hypothetical protein